MFIKLQWVFENPSKGNYKNGKYLYKNKIFIMNILNTEI